MVCVISLNFCWSHPLKANTPVCFTKPPPYLGYLVRLTQGLSWCLPVKIDDVRMDLLLDTRPECTLIHERRREFAEEYPGKYTLVPSRGLEMAE